MPFGLLALLPLMACAADEVKTYNNPVINYSLPDPTVIHASDGYFYLYATEDTHNVPIYRSKDLVKWRYAGTAFTDQTRPMDFVPVLDRASCTDFKILKSDQHQVFGRFTGTAILDDGREIRVKDFPGFAETQDDEPMESVSPLPTKKLSGSSEEYIPTSVIVISPAARNTAALFLKKSHI